MRAINASDCSRKTAARSSSSRGTFGANLRQISKTNGQLCTQDAYKYNKHAGKARRRISHQKLKGNLLFYWRVNLGSLDDLGQIVRFVLGAPEEVLRALVRVCQVVLVTVGGLFGPRNKDRPVVGRRRRSLEDFLGRAAEKNNRTMSQISHTEARTHACSHMHAHAAVSSHANYLAIRSVSSQASISRNRFWRLEFCFRTRTRAAGSLASAPKISSTLGGGRGVGRTDMLHLRARLVDANG